MQNKFLELIQNSINLISPDELLQKKYLNKKFRTIENQSFHYVILDLEKYHNTKETDSWKYDYLKTFYENNFSFDCLVQDAVSGHRKMTELYENVVSESLVIRISKKYKSLEMFYTIKGFSPLNRRNKILFLKQIKKKVLKIDEKGHIFIYSQGQPRYLSFKNIESISVFFSDSQFYKKIIQDTISSLLVESLNIKDGDFLYLNSLIENSVSNKYSKNTSSLKDVIKNINPQLYEFEFLDELMSLYKFKDVIFLAEILDKESTSKFILFYNKTRFEERFYFDKELDFFRNEFGKSYSSDADGIFKLIFCFLLYHNNLLFLMKSDWKIIKKIINYLVIIKGLLSDSQFKFKIQINLSNNILIHKSLLQLNMSSIKSDSNINIKSKVLMSKFDFIKNAMRKKGYDLEVIDNKRKLKKFALKFSVFSPDLFKNHSFFNRFLIHFTNTKQKINFMLFLESSGYGKNHYINKDEKSIFLFKNRKLNHELFIMPDSKDKKEEIEKTTEYFKQQILKKYSFSTEIILKEDSVKPYQDVNINDLF